MNNMRSEILDRLIPYFRNDDRYYLLVGDMGFGVTNALKNEFPKKVINCGIMEQGTVGIAAGMSMAGLIPIVYSIVNFIVYRAIEQIRNDVVLQSLNVKFISTGVNDFFGFLGKSHCCGQDDIQLMDLINLKVYDPYQENQQVDQLVDRWITDSSAGYFRV